MFDSPLPSSSLRWNKWISLSVPRVKINRDTRGFHSCALSLWNNLPLSVHSVISVAAVKKNMKTQLFDLVFPPARPMSRWCYGTASSILLLNTNSTVRSLNLALPRTLPLWKFDWLIVWLIDAYLGLQNETDRCMFVLGALAVQGVLYWNKVMLFINLIVTELWHVVVFERASTSTFQTTSLCS